MHVHVLESNRARKIGDGHFDVLGDPGSGRDAPVRDVAAEAIAPNVWDAHVGKILLGNVDISCGSGRGD
jgi:hypothetical protein